MNNFNGQDQLHNFLTFMSHKKKSEFQIKPPERNTKICLEKLFFQLVQNLLVQVSFV